LQNKGSSLLVYKIILDLLDVQATSVKPAILNKIYMPFYSSYRKLTTYVRRTDRNEHNKKNWAGIGPLTASPSQI